MSKIETLKAKITDKNLLLLNGKECNSKYYLEKLFNWQNEYDWVEWEEFKDCWSYCERCESYDKEPCICYAR